MMRVLFLILVVLHDSPKRFRVTFYRDNYSRLGILDDKKGEDNHPYLKGGYEVLEYLKEVKYGCCQNQRIMKERFFDC